MTGERLVVSSITVCRRFHPRRASGLARGRVWFPMLLCLGVVATDLSRGCFAADDTGSTAAVETEQVTTKPAATDFGTPAVESSVSESRVSTPWYDSEAGKIRPIELEPRQDDSVHRDSRWLPKPDVIRREKSNSTTTATSTTGGGNLTSNGIFGSSITFGTVFGWIVLAAAVLGIVGIVVYAVSRAELRMADRSGAGSDASAKGGLPDEQMLERIKHLPPELRRTDVNLRSECERLMGQSQFEQAIILLLGHQLLLLDRNGLLRLSRGKTNGRYVRETRSRDEACAKWLRETADAFEQSYFGRHEIPAEVFTVLWQQNEKMESAAASFGDVK